MRGIGLVWVSLGMMGIQAWASGGTVPELIHERRAHLEAFYHDIHENPELSGEEARTAAKVAEELRSLGYEVHERIGGHGLVGILRNGPGPTTLARAELDALPVTEDTGLSFKSHVPGKMHACGHDFHETILMGTAYVMAKQRDRWSGTLELLAQPAEETVTGAGAMVADGLFNRIPRPDHLIALHTQGHYKKGTIEVPSGFCLASVDSVDVTFRGRGAHGSTPQLSIDPFIMMAEFTLKLQTLLGREKDPLLPAVISVGSVHGGTKHNIIPDEVKMQLTIRTYDKELRSFLKRRVREVADGIAKLSGAPDPIVTFPESADAVYNDPALASRLKAAWKRELGDAAVVDGRPMMGSEDFGELGKAAHAPLVFFWLGEHNDKEPMVSNHSPRYAPDFKTLPLGIRAMVAALMELNGKSVPPAASGG